MNLQTLDSKAAEILTKYEEKRAATLPLLWLVQETSGHVTPEGEQWVADKTAQHVSHVREVVSFYTLYHTGPVGKQHIQVCVSTPCMLRGSKKVLAQLEEKFGIGAGQTTPDGKVTLSTVECLCACEAAPCAQVNDHYVGPLAGATLQAMLEQTVPGTLRVPGTACSDFVTRFPSPVSRTEARRR